MPHCVCRSPSAMKCPGACRAGRQSVACLNRTLMKVLVLGGLLRRLRPGAVLGGAVFACTAWHFLMSAGSHALARSERCTYAATGQAQGLQLVRLRGWRMAQQRLLACRLECHRGRHCPLGPERGLVKLPSQPFLGMAGAPESHAYAWLLFARCMWHHTEPMVPCCAMCRCA